MKAKGVDNSFFKSTTELTSSEQVKALCDGKIDAFGYSVGFPNGAMEQAATCAAKASPINLTGSEVQGLIDGADYYAKAVIPKVTYSNQKKDATTFGVKATVVTSASVSEELVYLVTKAVMENFDDFRAQHPAFGPLEKKNMIADGLSAPIAFISSSIVPLWPEPGFPIFTTLPFKSEKFLTLAFFLAQIWKGSL